MRFVALFAYATSGLAAIIVAAAIHTARCQPCRCDPGLTVTPEIEAAAQRMIEDWRSR